LPRIVGMGRALDLILTGRPVGAEEALAMGLVNRVAPSGESRRVAEALAAELAALPQGCLRSDRRSVYEGADLAFDDALANEFALGMRVLDEGVHGARAFTERRREGGASQEDTDS
jgi:enoyl-CoA hydratase